MPNINIENISDLDINGNDLFEDSESFITELDDEGESVMGGYYYQFYLGVYHRNFGAFYGKYNADFGGYYKNNLPFRKTNNCGNTVACVHTLGG